MADKTYTTPSGATVVAPAPTIAPPPSGTAQPVNTTMDASAISNHLTSGATTTLPPPNTSLPSSVNDNTSIQTPIPSAEAIINETTQSTPAEQKQKSILDRIAGLIGGGKGQTTLTNEAETAAGVPALTKTVNDLNTQLQGLNDQATALQNEASYTIPNQEQLNAEGRGITAGGLAPIQASDLRKNQIKQGAIATQALTVKSALYGAQGNLLLAKDAADKAATAQYEDQQRQIDYEKAQLDAIAPQLNKEEKAQAAIQTAKLADRQAQIDNAKEDKKTIIALATAALKNNPNDPTAQYAAQQALAESNQQQPNLQKVLGLIGKYQSDPIATEQAIASLAYTRAQTAKLRADTAAAGVPSITNPDATKYAGALSVILGSTKLTKEQKLTLVNEVNNGADPVAILKNQAKQVMTGANQTKVESYETAQESLKNIAANLDAFYAAGGKTNIVAGNYEKAINKLGEVNDPKLVELATQIQQGLQIYRNAVSGTAYSVQEGADIASIFPGIQKGQLLNNSIIAGRLRAFDDGIDGAYRGVLGSTYDDLKSQDKSPFDSLTNSISLAPNGTDALIPRDVWTTVQDKDGLLEYVKSLGKNLLVQ